MMKLRAAALVPVSLASAYFWLFSAFGLNALQNNSLPRQGRGVPFQYLFFVLIMMGILLLAPLLAILAAVRPSARGCELVAVGLAAVGILLLPAWDMVPWWIGGLLLAVALLAYYKIQSLAAVCTIALVAMVLSGSLSGICIAEAPWSVSTRLSRWWTRESQLCTDQHRPCLVYLTMANDLAYAVYVNYHTANKQPSVVRVTRQIDTEKRVYYGTSRRLDIEIERWVHTILIDDLKPQTRYMVEAGRVSAPPLTFTTAAAHENATVAFVNGGDAGTTYTFVQLAKAVRMLQPAPAFAIVGGDIAYANNFKTCYRVWDKWLHLYQRWMRNKFGDTIPFTAAIGNHEAQEEKWGDWIPTHDVNFYFDLFAQNSTYHAHRVGAAANILILDSGHVVPHEKQVPWIDQHYDATRNNVVAYHSPLYSPQDIEACTAMRVQRTYRRPQHAWKSVFARHHFAAILEHHTHLMKRSVVIDGNVYIGGGAWGVAPTSRWTTCADGSHGPQIKKAALTNHIWHAVVNRSAARFAAIGSAGQMLDYVET